MPHSVESIMFINKKRRNNGESERTRKIEKERETCGGGSGVGGKLSY